MSVSVYVSKRISNVGETHKQLKLYFSFWQIIKTKQENKNNYLHKWHKNKFYIFMAAVFLLIRIFLIFRLIKRKKQKTEEKNSI